ncbi:hypothetical protein NHN26_16590 [Rhodovulum tesquicola]|uniref:Tetratricopeptide repeat protein n=1 Tax=Rhodovulum steppense TaxID=540251 RepID=A0A4R1YWG2_9RHOB|nr:MULTISPECIES: hypothetical protein [Rhodovulum]MCO8146828.1 hypothetical protein [Rhodovulum tesquicola]TCM85519.1 hypothetical protein EV216_10793 [Rhodovulum steppense]
MFRVTPIGSCRIATPLRIGSGIYGYRLNRERSFGFTHSSAEAVQQVRFMRGEIEPPEAVWRFLAATAERVDALAARHDISDAYVIEICSAKLTRIGPWMVQANYLRAVFRDFLSDHARAVRFWKLAHDADQDRIDAFLREVWSDRPERIEECDTLRLVRAERTTPETLRRDMTWLLQALPEVMFVTHVDARRADGGWIASRTALIAMVESVALELGARVFNPTAAMDEWGQAEAIECDSESLAHYTEDFSHRVADLLMTAGLGEALIRAGVRRHDDETLVVDHAQCRLEAGTIEGLGASLSWAAHLRPGWQELLLCRVSHALAIGDHDQAASLLDAFDLAAIPVDRLSRIAALCAAADAIAPLRVLRKTVPVACDGLSFALRLQLDDNRIGDLTLPPCREALQAAEIVCAKGRPRDALELLLREHPGAQADALTSPAARALARTLLTMLADENDSASMARQLQLAAAAGLPKETTAETAERLRGPLLRRTEALARTKDLDGLITLAADHADLADIVPELFLALARVALLARRYEEALPAAERAAQALPEAPEPALLAMRAAANLRQTDRVMHHAERLARLCAPDHPHAVEAAQRMAQVPRQALNAARFCEDPLDAWALCLLACDDPELRERALAKLDGLRARIVSRLRERLDRGGDSLMDDIGRAITLMGPDPRLTRIAGRHLVRLRRHAEAAEFWRQTLEADPDDALARAELDRCLQKAVMS